ncbi:hypothetical protein TNCV_2857221 [Trichonephila clavipes]|nr:hypothetical protein TNCV_2857221 [Trichonephila clavipes]
MDRYKYDSVLKDPVYVYMRIVFPKDDGLYWEDNAKCHTARSCVRISDPHLEMWEKGKEDQPCLKSGNLFVAQQHKFDRSKLGDEQEWRGKRGRREKDDGFYNLDTS